MITAFLLACVMVTHDARLELRNAAATVNLNLGKSRAHALEVARDPKRHLTLRMEGISVEGEVGLWEVRVGNRVAGTLATYGAEESQGKYVATVVMDEAAEPVLRGGAKSLAITFAPAGDGKGKITIRRLRLVEE